MWFWQHRWARYWNFFSYFVYQFQNEAVQSLLEKIRTRRLNKLKRTKKIQERAQLHALIDFLEKFDYDVS